MTAWRELNFPSGLSEDTALVIEDDRADVILDPLRWRILEILGAGKSVAEISRALDVTDARVLYHLQMLARTGVVVLEEGARPGDLRGLPAAGVIRVREHPERGDQKEDAIPPEIAFQFNQAFREAAEGTYGPCYQESVNHNRARLSEEQAAEFSRRLLALIEAYFPPGKGDRRGTKYGFYGVLTPIDLHPIEDDGEQESG
ncbi:MAG: helix-turn-helix domain-containing protein [Gemmatimonadetes bacterium]|nr:helix-turn-helix domain-containing protein [Gemmatimonadota bacterium]